MSTASPTVIAVASGKGGTGKTTVAAHLALVSSKKRKTLLVDLDVEAPDSRGYFQDAITVGEPESVFVRVPRIEGNRCSGCGLCARSCRFGAIVAIDRTITVNAEACKGCGRCVAVCPAGALVETSVKVGETSLFRPSGPELLEGRMAVGDIRSTAVIEEAKRRAASLGPEVQVRDCPPGVSCPATHAIEGADYVVLVAEPTEFSRHDLEAAIRLVKESGLAAGVVINKNGFGKADIAGLCKEYGIPIIGRLAFTRERAVSGATARLWAEDGEFMAEAGNILEIATAGAEARRGNAR